MIEEKRGIFWSGPPDPDRALWYEVRSPRPGKEVMGVILSEVIRGVVVYYQPPPEGQKRGRSMPCTGDEETCAGCQGGRDHAWKGYLPCWSMSSGRLFLAEVTREAYLRCPAFELYKGALRGKALRLTRNGEANNSRVTAAITLWVGPPGQLPPAFNVESALQRIWFGGDGPRQRKPHVDQGDAAGGAAVGVKEVPLD